MSPMWIGALIAAGIAAVTDLRTGRIPNRLTLGAFAVGVIGNVVPGCRSGEPRAAAAAFTTALVAAAIGGLAPLVLWRAGALGGGDLKLFVALGAMLGPRAGLNAQFMAFLCGAVIAYTQLALRG